MTLKIRRQGFRTNGFTSGLALLSFISFSCSLCFAEVPTEIEADYSDAVLSYNNKDYERALRGLDQLLLKVPDQVELLELQALILKATNKNDQAATAYERLIKAHESDPKGAAPYQFELGMIRFREGKLDEAAALLESAAKQSFNNGATQFFLGTIAFRKGQFIEASDFFEGVVRSAVDSLKAASYFYLGQIELKLGDAASATPYLLSAQSRAQEQADDPKTEAEARSVAQQILKACQEALAPLDHSSHFAEVAALVGYDSNVLAVPSSTDSSSGAINAASPQGILEGGFGYMTSPLRTFQFTTSYRGYLNYNTNGATLLGDFFINDFSLYATHGALTHFYYGLKLEGLETLENQNSGSGSAMFGQYSIAGSMGPFLRWAFRKHWLMGFEVFLQPSQNALDSSLPAESARSGTGYLMQFSVQRDVGDPYFNPVAILHLGSSGASGSEYSSNTEGLTLSDTVRLNDRDTLLVSVDYSFSGYSSGSQNYGQNYYSQGSRNDQTLYIQSFFKHKLDSHLSLIAQAQFTNNQSPNYATTFQYNKIATAVGVNYQF